MILHLHIGRAKSGSTTIQQFIGANETTLADRGVVYPALQQGDSRHQALKLAIRLPTAPQEPLEEVIAALRRNPKKSYVLSDEGLLQTKVGPQLDLSRARRLIAAAGPGNTQILLYIRQYDDWIRSWYGQATKTANSLDDFDTFFSRRTSRLSVMSLVCTCVSLVGFDRVRVRALHDRHLQGGSLITDFLAAIGIEDLSGLTTPKLANPAANWMSTEFRRALARCLRTLDPNNESSRRLVRTLTRRFAAAVEHTGHGESTVQYLTPEQVELCREVFDRDAWLISEMTGARVPSAEGGAVPPRPFLPTLAHVPREVTDEFLATASRRRLSKTWPEHGGELFDILQAAIHGRLRLSTARSARR